MDDLENKNVFDGNDEELEKTDLPDTREELPAGSEDKTMPVPEGEQLDDKDVIESQLNDLVMQLKAKNEENILKDDVQDWDGLIDDSRQDAEDFVVNESADISDEKIESIEVMEIDEDDERLCSICHRRLKMEKDGITYEYCRRCRNNLLDTSYNWKSVLTFILSCVVFVFAVAFSFVAIKNFFLVKRADSFAEDAKLVSASNAYSALVSSSTSASSGYAPATFDDLFGINVGDNLVRKYADVLFERGDLSTLKSLLEAQFTEKDLEESKNADIKELSDSVNGLYNVGQAASGIIGSLKSPVSEEDAKKAIDDLEKLKEDESLDTTFLTYYQYYVSTMIDGSYDLQLEYLKKLEKEAPEMRLFYISGYANTYMYLQDYDKCAQYCDIALKDNIEDFSNWRMKIKNLYRQKKYDEALALSQEALKLAKDIYTSSDDEQSPEITYAYSVYMEQAAIYVFKGNMKKAQDAIDKAYQGQLTLDTLYLYAMINKKNGNDEAYQEVVDMLAQYEMTIPKICEEYINGTKTLEQIMVDGKVAWYE